MKIAIVGFALFLWSAFVMAAESSQESVRKEIDSFMTAWHQAAAVSNPAVYFGSMATDFVFLGTDAGERWTKDEFQKFAEPFFKRPSAWVFSAISRHISISSDGQIAWFDELLNSKSYWLTRGSGVLTRHDGQWKLEQYNMAFTIPNLSVNDIRPFIEKAFKDALPEHLEE